MGVAFASLLSRLALQGQMAVPYTTDFAAMGGYTVGNLGGQNSWQVTQGSAAITTTFAFSGCG